MSEATHTPLTIFIDAVRHQMSRTHDDKCGYGLAVALSNFEREKAAYDAAPSMLDALHRAEKSISAFLEDRDGGEDLREWDFGEKFGGTIDIVRAAIARAEAQS